MKIKRFDNLWLMGLILCGAILGGVYILKIFFPNFVIEVAHIESITRIGHYIDNHKWAWYLASIAISFSSCYIGCCACCRKKSLTYKELLVVLCTVIVLYCIKEFLPSQFTALNLSSMLLLPLIFKGDFTATVVYFSATSFLQTITLEIRNLNMMIADSNFATGLILLIDIYILQVLLYLYFNYKTEEQ